MNLNELRRAITDQVDYMPDNDEWHRYVNRLIDQTYRSIWTSHLWSFSQTEAMVPVYPDYHPKQLANPDVPYAFVTHGDTVVDLGDGSQDVSHTWDVGQIITIDGIDYGIQSVSGTARVYLDTPYLGESGSTLNWTIKHRWVYLPHDVAELIDIAWTDMPVPGVSIASPKSLPRQLASSFYLRNDYTAKRPTHVIISPDVYVPAPPETSPLTLTLSTSSTGGYLPAGTYKFAYSYVVGSPTYEYPLTPEGPMWASYSTNTGYAEITVPTSGTHTIRASVTLPQPLSTPSSGNPVVYSAKIYQVEEMYDGRLQYTELPNSTGLAPLLLDSSTGFAVISASTLARRTQIHPIPTNGRNQRIQLYPRPNTPDVDITIDPAQPYYNKELSWIHVAYQRLPASLIQDTDVPELPEEFSWCLIYKVVASIHQRLGNSTAAVQAERSYEDLYKQMRTRYGDQRTFTVRRGRSWGTAWPSTRTWPYLNPAIYTGDF